MTIARISNGSVAEIRDLSLNDVPEHKRSQWRPVVGEFPVYDSRTHTISGPTYQIEAEQVLRVWEITVKSNAELQAAFAAAIQAHVDGVAASRSYGGGVALASYKDSTNTVWSAEANAFISWRDSVWAYAYTELAKVQSGTRPLPTINALIAELPAITWPS